MKIKNNLLPMFECIADLEELLDSRKKLDIEYGQDSIRETIKEIEQLIKESNK